MSSRETTAVRVTLALLAASALTVGLAATVTPHGFFSGFPFFSRWVDKLPPYNEHLTTDVGELQLAFAALLGWAAARPDRALVVPVSLAWGASQLLHLAFHVRHLDGFAAADAVAQTLSLTAVTAAPLAVAWVSLRSGGGAQRAVASALARDSSRTASSVGSAS